MPVRPPIASRSRSPASSSPAARSASNASSCVNCLFGPVELSDAEAAAVLGREVHASKSQVARPVLEEVHELEARADVVRPGDELHVVRAPDDAQHEPADGVGGVAAVLAKVVPALVLRYPLVHPVRLDQPGERLPRQRAGLDRRLQLAHDGPLGLSGAVTGVELRLELVEHRRPVALPLVAEDVHEPREAVDRPQVRPVLAREEQRRDREVLRPGPGSHLWNRQRHATMLAVRAMVLDSPGTPLRDAELPDPEPGALDLRRLSTGPLPTHSSAEGTVSADGGNRNP